MMMFGAPQESKLPPIGITRTHISHNYPSQLREDQFLALAQWCI